MSETNVDLNDKRAQLNQKLASLKMAPEAAALVRQADAAVAKYRAEADALEAQIAQVDAEMGVREFDRRAAGERQRQERWLAQRKALLEEEEVRLQSIADAEAATRGLVDAINRTLASNRRMASIAQQLSTTGKMASSLSATELVVRLAGRITSLMGTIKGHEYRFGSLEWPGGAKGLYPADRSWREAEEKCMAAGLQALLENGKA